MTFHLGRQTQIIGKKLALMTRTMTSSGTTMICERCLFPKAVVKETRTYQEERGFHFILRRQECPNCGSKFKSIEVEKSIFDALFQEDTIH
jgi:hypothetical protein